MESKNYFCFMESQSRINIFENNQIDKITWDDKVLSSPNFSFFSLSWVLDILHPNWHALVLNSYDAFMPIPISRKFGIPYVFQPKFIRSLTIFYNSETEKELILQKIQTTYSLVNINFDFELRENCITGIFQKLLLPQNINLLVQGYSKNTNRILSKIDDEIKFESIGDAGIFIDFFKLNKKIKSLKSLSYSKLHKLIYEVINRSFGELIGAFYKGEMLACGIFISYNKQVYFLKGTVNKLGREKSALYGLINFVLTKSIGNYDSFDFIGSNDKGIANFYRKFGAKDQQYSTLKFNKTKAPLKQLTNFYLKINS